MAEFEPGKESTSALSAPNARRELAKAEFVYRPVPYVELGKPYADRQGKNVANEKGAEVKDRPRGTFVASNRYPRR